MITLDALVALVDMKEKGKKLPKGWASEVLKAVRRKEDFVLAMRYKQMQREDELCIYYRLAEKLGVAYG